MGRRVMFNPGDAVWAVVGAVCGLLAVRIFLADTSPGACGEAVDGLCDLVYRHPVPWFVWPAGAFVGGVVAVVCWSLRRFLPPR